MAEASGGISVRWASRVAKRAVDVGVSAVALLALLPLMAVLLLASAVAFRANPLFVQQRVGRDGRLFSVPKIRSLPTSVPAYADKREISEVPVPPFGSFLRRTHLDELPQLWTVLTGKMSLVGPRPEMPNLAEQFSETHAEVRATVRPGITGLWQVSEAVSGLIHERPEYDLAYVTGHSLRLDAWILWRTVRMLLPGGRPVRLEDVPAWATDAVAHRQAIEWATTGGQ